jgi:hypothetical protein
MFADDEAGLHGALVKLVPQLPHQHRSTLHHLMTHWCCIIRLQVECGVCDSQELISSMCHAFCHIMMRPSWENIV